MYKSLQQVENEINHILAGQLSIADDRDLMRELARLMGEDDSISVAAIEISENPDLTNHRLQLPDVPINQIILHEDNNPHELQNLLPDTGKQITSNKANLEAS